MEDPSFVQHQYEYRNVSVQHLMANESVRRMIESGRMEPGIFVLFPSQPLNTKILDDLIVFLDNCRINGVTLNLYFHYIRSTFNDQNAFLADMLSHYAFSTVRCYSSSDARTLLQLCVQSVTASIQRLEVDVNMYREIQNINEIAALHALYEEAVQVRALHCLVESDVENFTDALTAEAGLITAINVARKAEDDATIVLKGGYRRRRQTYHRRRRSGRTRKACRKRKARRGRRYY